MKKIKIEKNNNQSEGYQFNYIEPMINQQTKKQLEDISREVKRINKITKSATKKWYKENLKYMFGLDVWK